MGNPLHDTARIDGKQANAQIPGKKIAQALGVSPVHSVGAETKQSFNGTWITDSKMHKIFSKDVKIHEAFTGKYDVQKMLKFHENPSAEKLEKACDGIDC